MEMKVSVKKSRLVEQNLFLLVSISDSSLLRQEMRCLQPSRKATLQGFWAPEKTKNLTRQNPLSRSCGKKYSKDAI